MPPVAVPDFRPRIREMEMQLSLSFGPKTERERIEAAVRLSRPPLTVADPLSTDAAAVSPAAVHAAARAQGMRRHHRPATCAPLDRTRTLAGAYVAPLLSSAAEPYRDPPPRTADGPAVPALAAGAPLRLATPAAAAAQAARARAAAEAADKAAKRAAAAAFAQQAASTVGLCALAGAGGADQSGTGAGHKDYWTSARSVAFAQVSNAGTGVAVSKLSLVTGQTEPPLLWRPQAPLAAAAAQLSATGQLSAALSTIVNNSSIATSRSFHSTALAASSSECGQQKQQHEQQQFARTLHTLDSAAASSFPTALAKAEAGRLAAAAHALGRLNGRSFDLARSARGGARPTASERALAAQVAADAAHSHSGAGAHGRSHRGHMGHMGKDEASETSAATEAWSPLSVPLSTTLSAPMGGRTAALGHGFASMSAAFAHGRGHDHGQFAAEEGWSVGGVSVPTNAHLHGHTDGFAFSQSVGTAAAAHSHGHNLGHSQSGIADGLHTALMQTRARRPSSARGGAAFPAASRAHSINAANGGFSHTSRAAASARGIGAKTGSVAAESAKTGAQSVRAEGGAAEAVARALGLPVDALMPHSYSTVTNSRTSDTAQTQSRSSVKRSATQRRARDNHGIDRTTKSAAMCGSRGDCDKPNSQVQMQSTQRSALQRTVVSNAVQQAQW